MRNNTSESASESSSVSQQMLECLAIRQGVKDGLALGLDRYNFSGQHRRARGFCTSVPIPFSAFEGIRRSKHNVQLTTTQEENVMKSFDKLVKPADVASSSTASAGNASAVSLKIIKEISTPLPFVSVFIDQHCPELRSGAATASPASGATYLLLSVVTGHLKLCTQCLKLGASPNDVSFLKDENPAEDEMSHGYSPMFVAVLAEQLEIMDLLSLHGGSVHIYDRWGRTPLHAAVSMNSPEVVQWLLGKGVARYLGDYLNLIPAESAEEDYFPELAMSNPALYGGPSIIPNSYFESLKSPKKPRQRESSSDQRQIPDSAVVELAVTEAEGNGKKDLSIQESGKVSPTQVSGDTASHVAPSAGENRELGRASERNEVIVKCHCHSGRPAGYCGCVDDMYVRWSFDRLKTTWCPGVDFVKLAQQQQQQQLTHTLTACRIPE